jgi:plastocyanin
MIRLVFRFGLALAICASVACGGGSNPADAKVFHDAPGGSATVMAVTCPGTPAATVMDNTGVYSPMSVTITQGQIVKFVNDPTHDVSPNTTGSDSGLHVDFGLTGCLMFTHTGTFGFHCSQHGFMGSVTVQ